MYKKFLIIASKQDTAGVNITTQLSQFRKNPLLTTIDKNQKGFDFYLIENSILHEENLDLEKLNKYDFIIFASKHQSEKQEKTLSIHAPGNWDQAELGGKPNKLAKTSALFQKQLFEKLKQNIDQHELKRYNLTLECTHHGPLINIPCLFIEIGSTETEWKDRKAAFIVAKTISDTINEFKENPYNEIAIGVGGPHYCPNFNKIQLNSNIALSHIIPKYALPLTQEKLKQAIHNTDEEIDFAVLDWKGLGTKEIRDKTIKILEDNYIQWKKTGEVEK
ncbi:D-aminoacyl-tRNA deacylase [Nanoarchaeota archaeon]